MYKTHQKEQGDKHKNIQMEQTHAKLSLTLSYTGEKFLKSTKNSPKFLGIFKMLKFPKPPKNSRECSA